MEESFYTGLKALIVEDFTSYRNMLVSLFRDLGCKDVVAVSTGSQAVECCSQTRFDLIICDYELGRGKNGQEILEEVRSRGLTNADDIFVMVTADASKDIVMSSYDYHPDAYLTKPITSRALQLRVDRLLKQRRELADYHFALREDRWSDAEAFALREIDRHGRYQTVLQKLLADEYLKRGNYSDAQDIYRQVLEVRDVDWAQVGMARVKLAEGDIETAQKWSRQIITQFPNCLAAYDVLADVYKASFDRRQLELTLMQATDLSPLSFKRQVELGQVAESLQDFEVSIRAFSKAIRTGRYSYFKSVTPYLSYSRSGVALINQRNNDDHDLSRGVRRALDRVSKDFELTEEQDLQNSLIRCQFSLSQGHSKEAKTLFNELKGKIDNYLSAANVDTRLDIYRTLLAMNESWAGSYLDDIVETFSHDEEALQRIDPYLEEIKSEANVKTVAKINEKAIRFYQAKRYAEAVEQFSLALSAFPKITVLRLNVFQALIDSLSNEISEEYLHRCSTIEAELAEEIGSRSKHFKRFQQLRKRFKTFTLDHNN